MKDKNTQIPYIVECNNCKKDFDTKINIKKKRKEKIIDVGLECPHCKYFFHSYYLSSDLIKKQKALRKIRGNSQYFKKRQIAYKKKFDALQNKIEGV